MGIQKTDVLSWISYMYSNVQHSCDLTSCIYDSISNMQFYSVYNLSLNFIKCELW